MTVSASRLCDLETTGRRARRAALSLPAVQAGVHNMSIQAGKYRRVPVADGLRGGFTANHGIVDYFKNCRLQRHDAKPAGAGKSPGVFFNHTPQQGAGQPRRQTAQDQERGRRYALLDDVLARALTGF